MSAPDAVDLFAGPGGWDVGAEALGLRTIGIEYDDDAVTTRQANDLPTIHADVRTIDPLDPDLNTPGLIGSPPCQTFSTAGKGAGRRALDDVIVGIQALVHGRDLPHFDDERTALVLEPLRWILARHRAGRPFDWIVLEQVPTVRPVWEEYARVLNGLGYLAKTAVLSAEEYGVPQTRKRAILIARLDQRTEWPTATHTRYRHGHSQEEVDPGRLPWVSMAEALTWGLIERLSMTVTGGGTAAGGAEPFGNGARQGMRAAQERGDWADRVVETGQNSRQAEGTRRYSKSTDVPAPTVTGQTRSWKVRSNYGTGGDPANRGERHADEPSATITSKAGRNRYIPADIPEDRADDLVYRNGNQAHSAERHLDKPAPTVHFGARMNDVRLAFAGAGATAEHTSGQRPRHDGEPAHTITGTAAWVPEFRDQSGTPVDEDWPEKRPATTVAGRDLVQNPGATANRFNGSTKSRNDGVRVSPAEAAILQTFPPDFEWRGSKTSVFQQIGNAVPCLLAYRVLQAVTNPTPADGELDLFGVAQ